MCNTFHDHKSNIKPFKKCIFIQDFYLQTQSYCISTSKGAKSSEFTYNTQVYH